MADKRRRVVALHEAGHAIAAVYLGVKIKTASIEGGADHAGIVKLKCRLPANNITADAGLKHMVIALAGYQAERRGGYRTAREEWAHDRWCAAEYALRIGTAEEGTLFMRIAEMRARNLIEWRWPAVLSIADALEREKTLSGLDVMRIATAALRSTIASA